MTRNTPYYLVMIAVAAFLLSVVGSAISAWVNGSPGLQLNEVTQ